MRLFIAIGGLVLALLVAALVAPFFIDWTAWRASFESEASRLVGQRVQVRGEAHARLLPFPSVTFTDVQVGEDGTGQPSMTLQSFRMDAELAPYLTGEIRIFQMELAGPHLILPYGAGSSAPGIGDGLDRQGGNIVLENVVVTDGSVSLQNGSNGQRREFGNIDARLSASTLRGPFRGGGTFTSAGRSLDFSLSSGTIEAGGHWPFRLNIIAPDIATSFGFDGSTELGDQTADFAGRVDITSPAPGMERAEAIPQFRASADMAASGGNAALTKLRMEVGPPETPYVLTGDGELASGPIPHFRLRLQGEQVDLDRLAAQTLNTGAPITFADRAEAMRQAIAGIPALPIAGEVELGLPIFTVGDTTVRALSLTASPNADGWAVRQLRAELPGRTLVEATGLLAIQPALGFRGDVLLASRQPAGLVTWLGGAPGSQLSNLARAGFSARVDIAAERQRIDDLEVDVGGQTLSGRIERSIGAAGTALTADLDGAAVDVENFLDFARLFAGESQLADAPDQLDLRLAGGPIAYRDVRAAAGEIDLALSDGVLDLRSLSLADLAGADIEARGVLAGQADDYRPDIAFDLDAADAGRLMGAAVTLVPALRSKLPAGLVERASAFGSLTMSGTLAAAQDAGMVTLRAEGTADQTQVEASLTMPAAALVDGTADGSISAGVTLSAEAPFNLLRQFGFVGVDLGVPGPLRLSATRAGSSTQGETRLTASAPGLELAGEGTTAFDGTGSAEGSLSLQLSADDIGPWLSGVGLAVAQGLDALPVQAQGAVQWDPAAGWAVSDLAGRVGETTIASGNLARQPGQAVSGAMALSSLSVPWLATMVFGTEPDPSAAAAPWTETPFNAAFIAQAPPFVLDVSADEIALGGDMAFGATRLRLTGNAEGLAASDVEAELAGGRVSGSAQLSNSSGYAQAQAELRFADVSLAAADSPARGTVSGAVTLQASGQSYVELAGSASGAGMLSLSALDVAGYTPPAFEALLMGADIDGFTAEPAPVAALVGELAGGSARLDPVELPLEIGLGRLRAGPTAQDLPDGSVVIEGGFSLVDWQGYARLQRRYTPPETEAIADTAPAATYEWTWPGQNELTLVNVEPLTSYLSLRAYRKEQERLQAMRDDLQETLRLRRELRYINALERERRQRLEEAARQEEEARRQDNARRAEALRQDELAREEAERRAAEARADAARDDGVPTSTPPVDLAPGGTLPVPELRLPLPGAPADPFRYEVEPVPAPGPPQSLPDLPGVDPSLR